MEEEHAYIRQVLNGDKHVPTKPLVLTKETRYIADNKLATRDQIHTGDSVLFVENILTKQVTTKDAAGHYNTAGVPAAHNITYVIKLDLPFEYYNSGKQSQVAQRKNCVGNSQDSCVQTQLIDLYQSSGVRSSAGNVRTIQGIITKLDGTTIQMRTSSGRTFSLTTPSNIVADFNQTKSADYNNTKVTVGDLLEARYTAPKNDLALNPSQLISIQLVLNMPNKNAPIQKY